MSLTQLSDYLYYKDAAGEIYCGDCLDVLRLLPDESVQTCITSPPYWGLRDYGVDGQIGLEKTPEEYVEKMAQIFREVRRVLKSDGTLWLNLGDTYYNYRGNNDFSIKQTIANHDGHAMHSPSGKRNYKNPNLKGKDLVGIPWRVAFALQADGWWLRQDIIWHKPNPMPESVTDRCTKAHEYIFMLSKKAKYYYDADAIKEDAIYCGITGMDKTGYKDAQKYNGKHRKTDKQRGHGRRHAGFNDRWDGMTKAEQCSSKRNKRSVWTVTTKPYKEAHFATFPPDLIKPCVLVGCPEGGVVLDPFIGSGTTAMVAKELNRRFIGIDLNKEYLELCKPRLAQEMLL